MDCKLIILWVLAGMATLSLASCPICGNSSLVLVTEVAEAKDRAIQWLAGQQNVDGSWPNVNTQNAILALQLADPNWMVNQSLDNRLLTTSRLEYELMQYLLPSKVQCQSSVVDLKLGGGRLGQYMLALTSICVPIDEFYGIDLARLMTGLMKDFPEDNFNNFFQYSLAITSLCSSNSTICHNDLVELAEGFNSSDPCASQFGDASGHNIDILSLQVMAMICSAEQVNSKNGLANWETVLAARVQCISNSQHETTGSFGNAITTSLAIQALTAAGATGWECVSAMKWLLTQQSVYGDFSGVGATVQILPILGCNNLGGLLETNITCPQYIHLPSPPPIVDDDDTVDFMIHVKVSNITTTYSAVILDGENLYYGMIRLEESGNNFSFVSIDSSFGQSVQEINNIANDPGNSLYWTIDINQEGTHAQTGIEGLFPSEGTTYIFIYTDFS